MDCLAGCEARSSHYTSRNFGLYRNFLLPLQKTFPFSLLFVKSHKEEQPSERTFRRHLHPNSILLHVMFL